MTDEYFIPLYRQRFVLFRFNDPIVWKLLIRQNWYQILGMKYSIKLLLFSTVFPEYDGYSFELFPLIFNLQ